jgi:Skp family chaperone for outer membrane proteins
MLADADTLWTELSCAREGGASQRKCASKLHTHFEALATQLSSERTCLEALENKLHALRTTADACAEAVRQEYDHAAAALQTKARTVDKFPKRSPDKRRKSSSPRRRPS